MVSSRAWFALAVAGVLGLFYVGALRPTGQATAQQPAAEIASTYSVSAAGSASILVDNRTGRTWILRPSMDRTAAWLPIVKIDSDEEAAKWQAAESEKLKAIVAPRDRR